MAENNKYTMRMSLEVLKHLGFNLYSNIPAVLSEVVANSYDADADNVNIAIEENKITIEDDGNGMDLNDINDRFLLVGYQKRSDQEAGGDKSFLKKRDVMGRKGIGKLSLFSIADNIEIHTIKNGIKNGLILNRKDIEEQIGKDEVYHPKDVPADTFNITKGTRIVITQLKKNVNHTEVFLRKRLAKRFTVIDENFKVAINGNYIGLEDRDFFHKIQFFWLVGNEPNIYGGYDFEQTNHLGGVFSVKENINGLIKETPVSITGWIGTVRKPADLEQDNINNNKISIVCRGKLWLEDILKTYNESGHYATYLIGEIKADFLDITGQDDIATSSRQSIKEDDPRYVSLSTHIFSLIKEIKSVWGDMRHEAAKKVALDKVSKFSPSVFEWFNTLENDSKDKAKDLFATIETFHFDKDEETKKKKELYKQGIIAFEKLKLQDSLSKLNAIKSVNDLELSSVLLTINDIEANSYYDIASERVKIIKLFSEILDNNDLEKVIQKYLFDHLWLLDPSWERATVGTERMEENVKTAFKGVDAKLTEAEGKGRFDIRYRTSGGKHIIVELKRYEPTYKIDSFNLAKQANKYCSALEKCLKQIGEDNPHIEVLIILGELLDENAEDVEKRLKNEKARLIYYDKLVHLSLDSYSAYLESNKKIGKLRELIDNI